MTEGLEILHSLVSRYVSLSEEEWQELSKYWREHEVRKGDFVTRLGEVERYMYIVIAGAQRAFFTDPKGQEHCVQFSYAPGISGVPDSFWSEKPSRFDLQALSDSRFIRMTRPDLERMAKEHPIIERWLRLLIQDLMIGFSDRQIAVLSFTAEERFRRLVTNSPQAVQLIPQKHLASYLGMTAETFSRLRKQYVQ